MDHWVDLDSGVFKSLDVFAVQVVGDSVCMGELQGGQDLGFGWFFYCILLRVGLSFVGTSFICLTSFMFGAGLAYLNPTFLVLIPKVEGVIGILALDLNM